MLSLYGSSACDPKKHEKYGEVYGSRQVLVIVPRIGIDFQPGAHVHEAYEFFIPLRQSFLMQTREQDFFLKPNDVLLLPPGQTHGPALPTRKSLVLTIFVNKDFMHELYCSVFGTGAVNLAVHQCLFTDVSYRKIFQMREEKMRRQAGFQFVIENTAVLLVVDLLRQLNTRPSDSSKALKSEKAGSIANVMEFLQQNFNQEYSLKDLAALAEISPYHFIRVFKKHTGKTPFAYLMEVRIEKAKEMLKNENRTITEICFCCGFNNLNHFSNAFRRQVGLLPSKYRQYFL